jgi:hypothetical protein
MQLYVFDQNRELTGVVESFEYLRWTRRYSQCGSFELKAIATAENLALLALGHYLWKNDDEEAGIIEHVEMAQNEKETITVSGRFATSLLARRIVWGSEVLSGSLSDCVQTLLNNHIMNPSDPNRQIAYVLCSPGDFSVPVSTQISHKNLLDAVAGLCGAADIGIKTVFSPSAKTFTVTLYEGAVSQAVFSREYENLTEQTYTQGNGDYSNTALIGGEGEGDMRVLMSIEGTSGEERREVFVDAKDLRQDEFGDGYADALTFRGQSRLSELSMAQSFDAAVNPHGNLKYKADFDLGHVVKVISKKWGVTLTARITGIEESYDRDGQSLNVVFGKGVLSLMQKLKGII